MIESLQSLEDFRAPRGRRYPLWLILLLAMLGTLSGCYGYQALEDFCVRHYQALCQHLGITVKRLPSDSTFRRIFEQLDF
ncbi:transposase family protein [Gloeocapsopsis crepidinum LEGE 06123]|uniref:Transposase family protein n=1 Tax=Gloeocapsopsis crepidinum LEGE 06123 TaxID=588587 RepID=A0ABR9UNW1_9CHRO|nr:transposase family protein [Gloeocapsopsis crepidinum LEGE 06123]